MPLQQALESLYAARRTRAVETELTEQGMDDGPARKTEDSPINLTAKLRIPQIKLPGTNRSFFIGAFMGAAISLSAAVAAWIYFSPTLVTDPAQQVASVAVPSPAASSDSVPLNPVSASDDEITQAAVGRVAETQPVPLAETSALRESQLFVPALKSPFTIPSSP